MQRRIFVPSCYSCPYIVHYVVSDTFGCRKYKFDFEPGFEHITNVHNSCQLPIHEDPMPLNDRDAEREG